MKKINNGLPIQEYQIENRINNIINHLEFQLCRGDISEYLTKPKIVKLIWELEEELSK